MAATRKTMMPTAGKALGEGGRRYPAAPGTGLPRAAQHHRDAGQHARLAQVCEFHRSLGIPDEDHFVRPLAKRGYSQGGLELNMTNLIPEVTVNLDGVFWHPLSTDADMQISRSLFPLADSVSRIRQQMDAIAAHRQRRR